MRSIPGSPARWDWNCRGSASSLPYAWFWFVDLASRRHGGEVSIPLVVRWNAVDAYLDLDDSVVYFGEVEIGKGSDSPISRTVENHTPAPLSITVTKRAGPGPSCSGPIASEACRGEMRKIADSFDVNIDDCRQIPAFGSCELTVQFTPQAAFPMDASFTLHEADNREVRDRFL